MGTISFIHFVELHYIKLLLFGSNAHLSQAVFEANTNLDWIGKMKFRAERFYSNDFQYAKAPSSNSKRTFYEGLNLYSAVNRLTLNILQKILS